ncbi:MAG: type II toxin-antitoxin system death-on-curing family toxin [Christensenellaceae bacterium]
MLKYFDIEEAKKLHIKTIEQSGGGTYEIIDIGKLKSVLDHIQNDDYYPTIVDKVTHLFHSTCQFHCFADGNKRVAITYSMIFLLNNGYVWLAYNLPTVCENISYHVASGAISKKLLHEIFENLCNNTYDNNEELKLKILNAIKDNEIARS